MFAPTCIADAVVADVALSAIHPWSADTVNGTAPDGFVPTTTLCAAGAAPPACAVNPIALIDVVSDIGAVGVAAIPVPLNATRSRGPFVRVNVNAPLDEPADAGVNVTSAVKLCPAANVNGSAGPA